jgi:hypothetical protein
LLWEAMRANVKLSKDCHKAWCAQLAWFLKCIGVLSCEEMDMCNPPEWDMVAQAILQSAGSCRLQLLPCETCTCNAAAQHCWVKSLATSITVVGVRIPYLLVLSMARSRLSSHNLGVELGRHQEVVWFALGCKRCAAYGLRELYVDDEAHLLFSCLATAVLKRECRFE